ncbi:heat shock 70 kDa protein 12A [Rhizoctonia solani 123E]|uniref:Heat shock 70 kDa protein 12A n=1 Tax=Rhizoctonia solani 123E TaxID=1423351 RepID=A0A074SBK2_9AGAM|nr:heat shock 70 kDa protein 12A [Rhizoctonia solani 123E]
MEYVSGMTWTGETKIVIGIDIGTTQSAVAIGLLEHGISVSGALHTVTEWPGQDLKQAKIPTAIWYDTNGKAVSFGAETTSYSTEEQAEANDWFLAKHFKLLLHPEELQAQRNLNVETPAFPYGVTLEQVYSDFLRYLLAHTEKYFKDRIIDGGLLWSRYQNKLEIVIAHPNAWSTRQQAFLRKVAIQAGAVSATQAQDKVRFVTEGEASVHFCLADPKLNLKSHIKTGSVFAVCDAGGSTVDSIVYSVAATTPLLQLEEKRASGCVQAGGIFVDEVAKSYMQTALHTAGVTDEEDIAEYLKVGIRDFEAGVKRLFSNEMKDYFIKLGDRRVSFPSASVRRGNMVLPNTIIKRFFDNCVQQIFGSVDEQVEGAGASLILLVGGFADSPHLRKEFRKRYEGQRCQVAITDSSTAKAVANGIIIWSYSQVVISRSPRSTFGSTCSTLRDPEDPNHQGRESYVGIDGREYLAGKWDTIVTKGVPLQVTSVNRSTYSRHYSTSAPYLGNFEDVVEAYVSENPPYWSKNNNGFYMPGFRTECKVTANLQNLSGALEMKFGAGGRVYWQLRFSLCIRFGGVELEAFIEWEENGITRNGPATIIPDQPVSD